VYLDDISIDAVETCPDPSFQEVTFVTQNSATLKWLSNGGATVWEIEIGTTGFTPGTGNVISTSDNPYQLTSIAALATYDWYVRSNCGNGLYSNQVGPNTFSTPCPPLSIPRYEDFDTSDELPTCWMEDGSIWEVDVVDGNPGYSVLVDEDNSGTGFLYSPQYDGTSKTDLHVRFFTHWETTPIGFGQDGYFYGSPDGGATEILLDQWHHLAPSYDKGWKQYDISSWADDASNIVFWWKINMNTDKFWIIDDFGIQEGAFPMHTIDLPTGWSGLSSYIMPENGAMADVYADVLDELVIAATNDAMYYPAGNINTIGNWEQHSAYKVKMDVGASLTIFGEAETYQTIQLAEGWNLIPVVSNSPVDVETLFEPVLSNLTIVKEVAGFGVYWPEMGINNLGILSPGEAYYVLMNNEASVTFEDCEKSAVLTPKFAFPQNPAWNPVQKTAGNHVIGIIEDAMVDFEPGDYIGVFTTDDICAGQILIDERKNQCALIAFGMDNFGTQIQGFETGERFSFKLYKTVTGEEFEVISEFDLSKPGANGLFADNGVSVITGFKTSGVIGAGSLTSNEIVIYPNPTKGSFTISGITKDSKIEIFDMQGQQILTDVSNAEQGKQFNLVWNQPGIYVIRIQTGDSYIYKKLILK